MFLLVVCTYFARGSKFIYLIRNRRKRLDWKWIKKFYLCFLAVTLFASFSNKNQFFWWDAVILSTVITGLIVFYAITNMTMTKSEREYMENDKAFVRDKKIDSILKKRLW